MSGTQSLWPCWKPQKLSPKRPKPTCTSSATHSPPAARTAAFLKTLARDRLAAASDHYASQLGRKVTRITLRDTRSRWGSCAHDGALMYSWRLIMAPPHVLDYLAAHEVAHLVHMNHSDEFWALTHKLSKDTDSAEAWLKAHGASLHRYGARGASED